MTSSEFEYIQRAVKELEKTLELKDRVKIEKTMSQILARSAAKLEKELVEDGAYFGA